MRRLFALAGALSLGACTSDHHVSPYADVDIAAIVRASKDLDGRLELSRRETAAQGLHEASRVEGALPFGDRFVAVGYEGVDVVGRLTHAVRVVTPNGIVLALGPPDVRSPDLSEPDTLLASLGPSGVFPSGVDLTGDGLPDVGAVAPDGTLAVYRVEATSATRYPVKLLFAPTRADDVDGDGRADLVGHAALDPDDTLAPELVDVAIGDTVSFRDDVDAARAWHAAEAKRRAPAKDAKSAVKAKLAIERAFHDILSGSDANAALRKLDDDVAALAPLPDALSTSWVRWRGKLVAILSPR